MTDSEIWNWVQRLVDIVSGEYHLEGKTLSSPNFKKLIKAKIKHFKLDKLTDEDELDWIIKEATKKLGARGGRKARKKRAEIIPRSEALPLPPKEPEPTRLFPDRIGDQQTLALSS